MATVTCRVCGEALQRRGTPPVSCMACETAYHIDCWSYNGSRCGVYGCRGLKAVAGGPGVMSPGAVSSILPAPLLEIGHMSFMWQRARACLARTYALVALATLLFGVALIVPVAGLFAAVLGTQLLRVLLSGLPWLRSVELEDEGLTFDYLVGGAQRVRWDDVVRGPGRSRFGSADWSTSLLLKSGDVVQLPVGEPGFEEILERTETALIRDDLERMPVFIGE